MQILRLKSSIFETYKLELGVIIVFDCISVSVDNLNWCNMVIGSTSR